MADIKKVNVGGLDYNVKDDTARTNADTALSHEAYVENGNTASQAYAIIGTPINWKGTLYHTKTAVAAGATWVVGTNLTAVPNLGKMISSIKTYVGGDGKLHFTDGTGADTVLPFSGTAVTYHDFTPTISNSVVTNLTVGKQYVLMVQVGTDSGYSVNPCSNYKISPANTAMAGNYKCFLVAFKATSTSATVSWPYVANQTWFESD